MLSGEFWLLMSVVLAALIFDFINGMNDSGNAIATVIATRVLTPIMALVMATVLNFAGAFAFEGVAKTIAGKLIDTSGGFDVTTLMVLCGLLGAIVWSWSMTRFGLPISLSHSLIGGVVGVVIAAGGPLQVKSVSMIFAWMLISPLIGLLVGWGLMVGIMWAFRKAMPTKVNRHFRIWQIFSSASMAFSHGANDAQKAMGIITLALVAAGFQHVAPGDDPVIPLWVKIVCALVIALGTAIGGERVIHTLGNKIIKLMPVHGFAAETAAAGTIQLATILHIPVSTTHIISSSILGVGASKRLSAVRWGVASNIVVAWVLTIPTCAAFAGGLYWLVHLLGFR
jgi:PiT family inorganic phosphate transporter